MRSMAAGIRGYYLRYWRYGPETDKLVEEAIARESWSQEKWKAWQEERLTFVLQQAATKVPFYRDQWTSRRSRGDNVSWELLENWPILEKDSLRNNPRAFLAETCDHRRMFHLNTSGTTGTPLSLWRSRETNKAWYALFEARWRRWYGVTRNDRWGILGGQLITPISQRHPPFWIWNPSLNQLYLSSYHLSPDFIPYYLDALQRYRVKYLYGYTSSLNALAQGVLRLGRADLKFSVTVTNAEPIFDYQRKTIEEAFHCPVRETYGLAEIVASASECEKNRLHLWPEVGWIEIVNCDKPVESGIVCDIVCTGLLNADMPLIRYRIGDRGSLLKNETLCGCGRTLPSLSSIEGRRDDILISSDGRLVGRLDPIFKAKMPIYEAQIIQETLNRIRVRYVPIHSFSAKDADAIIERLHDRMGKVEVIMEQVSEIPRGANGKFHAVVCNLPQEIKKVAF